MAKEFEFVFCGLRCFVLKAYDYTQCSCFELAGDGALVDVNIMRTIQLTVSVIRWSSDYCDCVMSKHILAFSADEMPLSCFIDND